MKPRVVVAALFATVAGAVAGPGVAHAGPDADAKDPYAYGCTGNASVVASAPVITNAGATLGTAYLWYSWSCGTNWSAVRASVNSNGVGQLTTNTVKASYPFEWQPYTWTGYFVAGSRSWSDMIYAPTSCVTANVFIQLGNGDVGEAYLTDPTC
ncbi:hypothetical protein [Dactylosporangium sp. CA-233914]|uniref:hypothetical protein n=1 Tax=Dactylosporangium sp. CA-233914 TaxID=3239934 RepID=UPI003D9323D2